MVKIIIGFVLSSILTTFYLYYENGKTIKARIEAKVMQEMLYFQKDFKEVDFTKKDEIYYNFVDKANKKAKENNVLFFEIYGKDNVKLFKLNRLSIPKVVLKHIKPLKIISHTINYILVPVSDDKAYLYLQTKINYEQVYYINMIIKLNKQTISIFSSQFIETIFIIFITILIVLLLTFSTIHSQYKTVLSKEKELLLSNIEMITSLGNAMSKRDSDTSQHNYRVTYYSIKLAQKLNLSKHDIRVLIKGAFLHDIGKIAISDNILLKPAKLTIEEFEIMKTHTTQGIEIIGDGSWLEDAKDIILYHHEKVDGSGYPCGLKGDEIPRVARIFSIVDVFDALTSKRPYKKPFSLEQSINIIKSDSGSHFDKDIVASFESIYENIYYEILDKTTQELRDILMKNIEIYFDVDGSYD